MSQVETEETKEIETKPLRRTIRGKVIRKKTNSSDAFLCDNIFRGLYFEAPDSADLLILRDEKEVSMALRNCPATAEAVDVTLTIEFEGLEETV